MTLNVDDGYLYAVAEIVTPNTPRPATARECAEGRYHVWAWRSTDDLNHEDLRAHVPDGLRCQCGAFGWEEHAVLVPSPAPRRRKR